MPYAYNYQLSFQLTDAELSHHEETITSPITKKTYEYQELVRHKYETDISICQSVVINGLDQFTDFLYTHVLHYLSKNVNHDLNSFEIMVTGHDVEPCEHTLIEFIFGAMDYVVDLTAQDQMVWLDEMNTNWTNATDLDLADDDELIPIDQTDWLSVTPALGV